MSGHLDPLKEALDELWRDHDHEAPPNAEPAEADKDAPWVLHIDVADFFASVAEWRAHYAHTAYIEPCPDDEMNEATDRTIAARLCALAPLGAIIAPLAEILVHEAGFQLPQDDRAWLVERMATLAVRLQSSTSDAPQ